MSFYSDVFERKEMKYHLDAQQLASLMPILDAYLIGSDFGDTRIRSLYYDTPSNDLIARSTESPIYKEKLRVRVYGNAIAPTTPAFVEIKKKYKGIVYKRRIALSLRGATSFLNGMPYEDAIRLFPLEDNELESHILENASRNRQIASEIAFFMKRYEPLEPSILTICDRRALIDPNGTDLRITIDTNLRAKNHPKGMDDLRSSEPLIPNGNAIMEIKSTFSLPLWLASALSGAKAYKQSFSKCGTSYVQMHSKAQYHPKARWCQYAKPHSDETSHPCTSPHPDINHIHPSAIRAACIA